MALLALLVIALLLWLLVGPVIALVKLSDLRRRVDELERRLAERARTATPSIFEPLREAKLTDAPPAPSARLPSGLPPPSQETAPVPASPPPLPPTLPPPLPMRQAAASQTTPAPAASRSSEGGFSWEQFVGVKLFAWIGGLALFFGIVFFVKYAFEREMISPAMRVGLGYLTGALLMAAGYWFRQRQAYQVLTQTLSATGILAFYGVTYAAHAWYHFPVFTTVFTFALMALITAAAFITAVRAKSQAVAVLGLAGGFLTPALVASGQDQPVILFAYVALLNLGLLALVRQQKWPLLLPLGAIGTVLIEWGWRLRFFDSGDYAQGLASWGVVAVFGGFALFFSAAAWWTRKLAETEDMPWYAALLVSASALLLALDFLAVPGIAARPLLLYSLVALAATGWVAAAWWSEKLWMAGVAGCLAVMLHLSLWMWRWLTPELLLPGLGLNLAFGLAHLFLITRLLRRGLPVDNAAPSVLALLMMAVTGLPVVLLQPVSWLLWPPFWFAGLLTLAVAALNRKTWIGLMALLLTLGVLLYWLTRLSPLDQTLPAFLIVLGMSTLLFGCGAELMRRRLMNEGETDDATAESLTMLRIIQWATLSLPFALLSIVPGRLGRMDNPAWLFSATLLLSLAAIWLSRKQPWLTLSAWPGWILVSLQFYVFVPGMLIWQLAVPALAFGLLWLMRKSYGEAISPYAALGVLMSGCLWILHDCVTTSWPVWLHGLLPVIFALAWIALTRRLMKDQASLAQRSVAGGLAVWFVTLIFVFQFDLRGMTIAWALEAAALCWLFTRLPHDGLRLAGAGLAAIAFVLQISLGWVLDYHDVPLHLPMSVWLLISFGLTGLAMLAAAHWLKSPHHVWRDLPLRVPLCVFGGVLLFALLNLQIANAFTPPGSHHLVIQFGGHFARDMSYSIAWGLFALALLLIGFWKKAPGARYAGVGLLLVTLGKLFLHDLDQVGSIYRIGAFLAVAVIALGASFLYQRAGRKAAT